MTGEAGYHNLGDEAQALASAHRLRLYFPEAEIVATGLDPLGAVLRHQARILPWPLTYYDLSSTYPTRLVRKVARKLGANEDFLDPVAKGMDTIFEEQYQRNARFRSVLAEVEQADFIFDMGHGGLNDVFDIFMLCFLYYLAARLAKPLFISGQSVGPLWRPQSIKMLRETLPHAHTVGLRDKNVSRQILTDQVRIDTNQVRLAEIGDDTLALKAREPDLSIFSPSLAGLLQDGAFFAVEWRGTDYTQAMNSTELLDPLVDAVTCAYQNTGLPPVFVPLSWEPGGDILAAARMHDLVQARIPLQVVWPYLQAAEIKWLLGRAHFGIGLSYHFHVFLLSQGIPSIGLYTNSYYDIKLRGAFAAFGYQLPPIRYPDGVRDGRTLDAALTAVTQWSDGDRRSLIASAEASCSQWHRAFQAFLHDNSLDK